MSFLLHDAHAMRVTSFASLVFKIYLLLLCVITYDKYSENDAWKEKGKEDDDDDEEEEEGWVISLSYPLNYNRIYIPPFKEGTVTSGHPGI